LEKNEFFPQRVVVVHTRVPPPAPGASKQCVARSEKFLRKIFEKNF